MLRFVDRPLPLALALVGSFVFASPASTQDAKLSTSSVHDAADAAGLQVATELPAVASRRPVPAPASRPISLVPLYVAFGGLQAFDAHSTIRALDAGAAEGNPMMKAVAGSRLGLVSIKAASTAAVIYGTERLAKRNRTAAVLLMIAGNSAMAWVVQHNYRARARQ